MVIFSGAHTVGVVHCGTFGYRLTSDAEKGMDAAYRTSLRSQCNFNANNKVPMDAGNQYAFDSSYFANRTATESDAALNSPRTVDKVRQWKNDNPDWFKASFASAMVKMGGIRGTYGGKVRVNCRRVTGSGRDPHFRISKWSATNVNGTHD